jgi:hypothetical protein
MSQRAQQQQPNDENAPSVDSWAAEDWGISFGTFTAQPSWHDPNQVSSGQVATPPSFYPNGTILYTTPIGATQSSSSWYGTGQDAMLYQPDQGSQAPNLGYAVPPNHIAIATYGFEEWSSGNSPYQAHGTDGSVPQQQAPIAPDQPPTRSYLSPTGMGNLPGPERTSDRRRPLPRGARLPEHPYRPGSSSLRYPTTLRQSYTDYQSDQRQRDLSIQPDSNSASETIFESTQTPAIEDSEPTQPALLKETVLLGTLASGTVILLSPVPTGQIALTAHKVQISDKIFQFVFHKRAGSSKAQATSSVLSKASDLVKGQHEGIPRLVSILGANHLFIRELTSFANELKKAAGFDMLLGKGPSNDLRFGMHELNRKLGISEPIDDLVDSLHEQVLVHNAAWLIITQYGPLLGGNTRLQSYRLLNAPSVGY